MIENELKQSEALEIIRNHTSSLDDHEARMRNLKYN